MKLYANIAGAADKLGIIIADEAPAWAIGNGPQGAMSSNSRGVWETTGEGMRSMGFRVTGGVWVNDLTPPQKEGWRPDSYEEWAES